MPSLGGPRDRQDRRSANHGYLDDQRAGRRHYHRGCHLHAPSQPRAARSQRADQLADQRRRRDGDRLRARPSRPPRRGGHPGQCRATVRRDRGLSRGMVLLGVQLVGPGLGRGRRGVGPFLPRSQRLRERQHRPPGDRRTDRRDRHQHGRNRGGRAFRDRHRGDQAHSPARRHMAARDEHRERHPARPLRPCADQLLQHRRCDRADLLCADRF